MIDVHVMILDCCTSLDVAQTWDGKTRDVHDLRIAIESDLLKKSHSAFMQLPYNQDIIDALIGIMRDADSWVIGALASGLLNARHHDLTLSGLYASHDRIDVIADRWIENKYIVLTGEGVIDEWL